MQARPASPGGAQRRFHLAWAFVFDLGCGYALVSYKRPYFKLESVCIKGFPAPPWQPSTASCGAEARPVVAQPPKEDSVARRAGPVGRRAGVVALNEDTVTRP